MGIILGDAHIVKRSSTGNSRLVYAQTAVAHKEYFNYVYSLFMPFCAKDYISQSSIIRDNRTQKNYKSISFTTMQLPCFNVFKEMFYLSNVKRVPYNIYEALTPRGLAFCSVSFFFIACIILLFKSLDLFCLTFRAVVAYIVCENLISIYDNQYRADIFPLIPLDIKKSSIFSFNRTDSFF